MLKPLILPEVVAQEESAHVTTLHQVSRISHSGVAFPPFRPPAQLGAEDTWERGGNKSHMFPSRSEAALHGLFSERSPFSLWGEKTLIVVDLLVCNNFEWGKAG